MKFILKLLFIPFMLTLWILCGMCNIILKLSTIVLAIIAMLFATIGVITIITDSALKGFIDLAIAFVLSPYGLPTLAAMLIAQFYILRMWLQEKIYGKKQYIF